MRSSETLTDANLVISGTVRIDGHWVRGEVWVAGETIVAVYATETAPSTSARRLDVGAAYVLPGAVDAHVHTLSHPGEGIDAATAAAAAGGVTTIVEMPFDGTGAINTPDRLKRKQDLVFEDSRIDVALLATLAPGGGWREAESLASGGASGFKVSLFDTDPVRFPRIGDRELLEVMKAVAGTGRTLCTHAENNEIVKVLLAEERATAQPDDAQAHSRTRPPVSETLGVLTAMEIAATMGTALHLCHLSVPRSVDLVCWYQSQGADISLETCPHYLTFTEDDLERQRGRLKINPPLRTARDRDGLWERVADGSVGVISSDHAPWSTEMKDHANILDNHSGVPGVETIVPVTLGRALARSESTFSAAVDALSIRPARRFGLEKTKGSLTTGRDADIMIFQPDTSARIDESSLHSNAGWSPYDGMAPGGFVSHTFSRGELVWDSSAGLSGSRGRGRLVVAHS